MADLDDELARFEAELKALEQQSAETTTTAAEATSTATTTDNASTGAAPSTAVSGTAKRAREDDSADKPSSKKLDTGGTAPAASSSVSSSTAGAPATASTSTPAAAPARSGLGSGGLAKPVVSETVVIRSAPKVYMAPPRPAPVKKAFDSSAKAATPSSSAASSAPAPGRPGVPNTLAAVFAHRGALSSEVAARAPQPLPGAPPLPSAPAPAPAPLPVPRFDVASGRYLSAEETQLMDQQQSVYAYDPDKPLTRAPSAAPVGAEDAAGGGGSGGAGGEGKSKKPKRLLRVAGGEMWEDPTLADWPENDFRLFCGDLGNEVSDEVLAHAFARYATFQRARVVRDKYTHKSRGYGFVSFADPFDCGKALREMNGKYIGNRPVKLSKSKWQDRNIDVAKKKMKKKNRHLFT